MPSAWSASGRTWWGRSRRAGPEMDIRTKLVFALVAVSLAGYALYLVLVFRVPAAVAAP